MSKSTPNACSDDLISANIRSTPAARNASCASSSGRERGSGWPAAAAPAITWSAIAGIVLGAVELIVVAVLIAISLVALLGGHPRRGVAVYQEDPL